MMETKKVKVLELFSGIGGMHYSLCRAKNILNEIYEEKSKNNETPKSKNNETPKRFDFEVVSAVDISEVANKGKTLKLL
jgi:site-specific DNA-cytosine methylase